MELGPVSSWLSAVGTCITAFIAWRASTVWFRQHHLGHARDLAIRVVRVSASIRRAFAEFRNPLGPTPKLGEETLRGRGEALHEDANARRVQVRDAGLESLYSRIWIAIDELDSLAADASMTWNFDIGDHVGSMRDLAAQVGEAMGTHLWGKVGARGRFDADQALRIAYAGGKNDPVLAGLSSVLEPLEVIAKERYASALPPGARRRWAAGPAPLSSDRGSSCECGARTSQE